MKAWALLTPVQKMGGDEYRRPVHLTVFLQEDEDGKYPPRSLTHSEVFEADCDCFPRKVGEYLHELAGYVDIPEARIDELLAAGVSLTGAWEKP